MPSTTSSATRRWRSARSNRCRYPEASSSEPSRELELHETPGHTADGVAYWLPWLRVLVCGDYLSPVEIPMLSESGSLDAYSLTLAAAA